MERKVCAMYIWTSEPGMPVPLVGRELAEAGNTPFPAMDLGQRGVVPVIGNGELPVLGGRNAAGHLVDAPTEGLGPGLLIRSADAGLPLVGRHLPLGYVCMQRRGRSQGGAETWRWRNSGDGIGRCWANQLK